jgi:hypothetical protein
MGSGRPLVGRMELTGILSELIRRRILVGIVMLCALGIAVSTQYRLPSFERRSYEFGAAQTQLLVDAAVSPLGDVNRDIEPLATRAVVYARFMTSLPVREAIAREADLPLAALDVSAPFNVGEARFIREAPAERRANELLGEERKYRMLLSAEEGLPIVTVSTQAPTAPEAERVANAGVTALAQYVASLQKSIRERRRIEIRPLGEARGGVVNDGASKAVGVLAFLATFAFGCLVILGLSGMVRLWRNARATDGTVAPEELAPLEGWASLGDSMPRARDGLRVVEPADEAIGPARR